MCSQRYKLSMRRQGQATQNRARAIAVVSFGISRNHDAPNPPTLYESIYKKKKKKQINTDLGGQDDQTAQRSRLESGTKTLPVPFRQCLARIYYVCICFISPPTSRLLTLNAGYVCKQPEKCQFQAYSSAPFICQLCLTFQKQATAEIISCPFQHQLKLNDVKYGKLHRRKFRRNYQVPYSLLMGLNCALGSNRRLRGAAKSWKKLSLT